MIYPIELRAHNTPLQNQLTHLANSISTAASPGCIKQYAVNAK
jgi:hypothetical protein